MNKVGVITFHKSNNYGAILQTYALQSLIRELGHEPEVIDYYNKRKKSYHSSKLKGIISFSWQHLIKPFVGGNLRNSRSDKFRKEHIVFSSKYTAKEKLMTSPPLYDSYITGSDQVWNPNITEGDAAFFLDFAHKEANKISYGASFGIEYIPEKYKNDFKTNISKLDFISVRETNAKMIIESFNILKNIEVVLDPTLLLSRDKWETLISKDSTRKKYILCYYMPGDREICQSIKLMAEDLARKNGLEIINIGKKEYSKLKFWENNLVEEGPLEFLELIKAAEYVITNSFHGTAFSIIFEKQFFVPIRINSDKALRLNSRIISLLKLLGLESQLIPTKDIMKLKSQKTNDIYYETVNKVLNVEQIKSINFLKNALLN